MHQVTSTCWIYKSPKKEEMYLYVPRQDNFEDVPEFLLQKFGNPLFVMELELTPDRKLARENAETILNNLAENGFHLQMPPQLKPSLYHGNED
ncbi:MAG: YcgL domain-containing protein [Gammaproteobacteria bacterium]|nr:YcgL domain-containing protein [Gammaproteobacteria bacterium]